MSIFQESERRGPLSDRLRARGYTVEEARIGSVLAVRYRSPAGRVWATGKNMVYPMNNRFVHQITSDKRLSYELAKSLGITVPNSMYVVNTESHIDQAIAFMQGCGRVIVKPLDSYKSRGVSLNITAADGLEVALGRAFEESSTAIIQEQVEGEEYRFTVLEGKVVSVLRRERPQVIGDGIHTIAELIAHENEQRKELQSRGLPYPLWTSELIGDSEASEEVLDKGAARLLSNATLVSRGASVYELQDETDQSYKAVAEQFAAEIGAGLCAVDMFILDHTKPAEESAYWFNECNASPSLKMYSMPRNANSQWVTEEIVDTTDRYLNINT